MSRGIGKVEKVWRGGVLGNFLLEHLSLSAKERRTGPCGLRDLPFLNAFYGEEVP